MDMRAFLNIPFAFAGKRLVRMLALAVCCLMFAPIVLADDEPTDGGDGGDGGGISTIEETPIVLGED